MINISEIISTIQFTPIFKIITLVVLGLYLLFCFILLTQVRSLNNLIYIRAKYASKVIAVAAVVYFFAGISLFLLALVIL